MDYYKISHQDSKVDDEFINTLRDAYKSIFEYGSGKMKAIRGKAYDQLGITLDHSVKGKFNITIMDYINEIL